MVLEHLLATIICVLKMTTINQSELKQIFVLYSVYHKQINYSTRIFRESIRSKIDKYETHVQIACT